MKNVMISIRGTQTSEGDDPQVMELTTEGTMSREGDAYAVTYVESPLTGMEGVVTTFRVEDSRVEMRRRGTINTNMVFTEGGRYDTLYDAGFGAMLMTVVSSKVRTNLGDNGGSFLMDYRLEVEHIPIGRNVYEITVREVFA